MSLLYRTPVIVRKKRPYVDWANGISQGDDDATLTIEAASVPEIYLGPASEREPTLESALEDLWSDIFEEALHAWSTLESDWPESRTREMFDHWFDVELADLIVDLAPDDPLTDDDLDAIDIDSVVRSCGWCGTELFEDGGRVMAFPMAESDRVRQWGGRPLPLPVDRRRTVLGIVSASERELATEGGQGDAAAGEDAGAGREATVEPGPPTFNLKACSRPCEKHLSKTVPRALRELEQRNAHQDVS